MINIYYNHKKNEDSNSYSAIPWNPEKQSKVLHCCLSPGIHGNVQVREQPHKLDRKNLIRPIALSHIDDCKPKTGNGFVFSAEVDFFLWVDQPELQNSKEPVNRIWRYYPGWVCEEHSDACQGFHNSHILANNFGFFCSCFDRPCLVCCRFHLLLITTSHHFLCLCHQYSHQLFSSSLCFGFRRQSFSHVYLTQKQITHKKIKNSLYSAVPIHCAHVLDVNHYYPFMGVC